jgi:hypothetical protein
MTNYRVIVISRLDDVPCEFRRFKTKSDAEQALEVCKDTIPELIAEVSEMREDDASTLDKEPITFDEWCYEEVSDG